MMQEKFVPPKQVPRFQLSTEEGNKIEIVEIEDKTAKRMGHKTYQIIEVVHVRNYPEVSDLKSKKQNDEAIN